DVTARHLSRHSLQRRIDFALVARMEAVALRAAERIVAWTDWAARSVVQDYGIPAERVFTIPPPVRLAALPQRRVSGSKGPPVRLLLVGNDFERKGGYD